MHESSYLEGSSPLGVCFLITYPLSILPITFCVKIRPLSRLGEFCDDFYGLRSEQWPSLKIRSAPDEKMEAYPLLSPHCAAESNEEGRQARQEGRLNKFSYIRCICISHTLIRKQHHQQCRSPQHPLSVAISPRIITFLTFLIEMKLTDHDINHFQVNDSEVFSNKFV